MKLKAYHKIVMFYGNALHIPSSANWVAANVDGRIKAYVEEPHISHGFWEAETGAIWSIDADTKFEDENWKDTLTHCPQDQRWMIEAAAELRQAWNLHVVGLLPSGVKELVLNSLADTMLNRAEGNTSQAAWDGWMKHAVPEFLRDEDFTNELYDRCFPKPKEPEYHVVKDYYGRDIIVPLWAQWIAMDQDGEAVVFMDAPNKEDRWWRRSNYENPRIAVAWFPRHIAESSWHDSLREARQ